MNRFATILVAAAAASACAVAATAAPQRLSDVQYVEASRCVALMSSASLGAPEGAELKAYVERQGWSREPAAQDAADEAREDAGSAAARAKGYSRTQLIAERDGVCRSFLAATTAAASQPTTRSLQ